MRVKSRAKHVEVELCTSVEKLAEPWNRLDEGLSPEAELNEMDKGRVEDK